MVDAIIQWAAIGALAAVAIAAGGLSGPSLAVLSVGIFVIFWGYDVFFEVLASGRTPGKRWNGLRVVRSSGRPIGFLASAIRNLLRVVDWLPSFYLVGGAAVVLTGKNQRVGDLVADTIVVREQRASQQAPRAFARTGPAPQLASSLSVWDTSMVTVDELAAVRSFLARRWEIDLAARKSLAATLEQRLRPKVAGMPDDVHGEPFLEALVAAKTERR
jgi:uncharacterized RDD family membrane protein YckC